MDYKKIKDAAFEFGKKYSKELSNYLTGIGVVDLGIAMKLDSSLKLKKGENLDDKVIHVCYHTEIPDDVEIPREEFEGYRLVFHETIEGHA